MMPSILFAPKEQNLTGPQPTRRKGMFSDRGFLGILRSSPSGPKNSSQQSKSTSVKQLGLSVVVCFMHLLSFSSYKSKLLSALLHPNSEQELISLCGVICLSRLGCPKVLRLCFMNSPIVVWTDGSPTEG